MNEELPLLENGKIIKSEKYLLQIDRIKLQDYVQCALITADKYLSDECAHDLQSKNTNYLVLSNGYIEELNEEQILIELILTEEEQNRLIQVDSLYYFDFPLPISRIKKIYTHDKKVSKGISLYMETLEKGFLPLSLFDVYKKRKHYIFEEQNYQPLAIEDIPDNYSQKVRYFDKRMGMFSFVKNTNLYYANEKGFISNYSDHYFSMLSFLLKEKMTPIDFDGLDVLKENDKFRVLIFSENQIDNEFMQIVLDDILDPETKEIFSRFLQPNKTRSTLALLLENKLYIYYYIGLVYYFGFKDSNRKDNIKSEIGNLIPYELAETALAILGIYLGYKSLRPKDKIELQDKYFAKLFPDSNIKFRLDSKLDYITIETIYRYCFCTESNKKGYEFEYLEYPSKQKPFSLSSDKTFKQYYKVRVEEYFEGKYIYIEKRDIKEILLEKLNKYDEEIIFSKHYLSGFIAKYFKSLISYSKNGKPCEPYCQTSSFKEQLIAPNLKVTELLEVLELDKK